MKSFFDCVKSQGRTALAIGIAAGAIGLAGGAMADPINFLPTNTNFKLKFSNEEIQIVQSGQELFGIFNINAITDTTGSVNYWTGNGVSDGTQLVGFFTGLISVIPGPGGPQSVDFTGGSFAVYDVANGDYDTTANQNLDPAIQANREAQLCGGVACPTPWLTGLFAPGILDPNMLITLDAALAPTSPLTAKGTGYLSVGTNAFGTGTNNAAFDSNAYTFSANPPADMLLLSEFSLCPSSTTPACSAADWQVRSDDPIFARRVTVPEPGTLLLLGLGGLLFGAIRRNKSV
jgi:hypothetical protein